MRPDDFFEEYEDELEAELFGVARSTKPRLRHDLLVGLRRGQVDGVEDVEAALGLTRLVHDDLEAFGTGGGEQLTDAEMRDALLALKALAKRINLTELDIPFRDFTSFKSWWLRNDGFGSWQARRDLLSGIFDPAHDRLIELDEAAYSSDLSQPVSPRGRTGWQRVDAEIAELRRHFQAARTPQDYRNVGNDAVAVTEALSRVAYNPARHLRDGEAEPPVANTKQRLECYVEVELAGRENAELRRLVRASIESAQVIKHRSTPSRRDAGMAADAVILLANLLRRIAEPER